MDRVGGYFIVYHPGYYLGDKRYKEEWPLIHGMDLFKLFYITTVMYVIAVIVQKIKDRLDDRQP
jgi:hypothetical protein